MNVNYDLSTSGTFNVGVLRASFAELVERFGYPQNVSGEDKVRVEWILSDNGRVITIYDWKEDKPVEQVKVWSVGGLSTRDWVSVALEFKL